MQRAIISAETGELEYVDLTPEEQAEVEAERAAAAAQLELADATATTEIQIRQRLETALEKLEQAGAGWAELTPAQKDTAMRLTVRATAKLVRLQLRRLDAIE